MEPAQTQGGINLIFPMRTLREQHLEQGMVAGDISRLQGCSRILFLCSSLWRAVHRLRWSRPVPKLSPKLHQWPGVPVLHRRAQGLWYHAWNFYGILFLFAGFLMIIFISASRTGDKADGRAARGAVGCSLCWSQRKFWISPILSITANQ